MQDTDLMGSAPESAFEARARDLRRLVAESAQELSERGIRPTVTRIRAALGGGSPNDLTPALKAWRESSTAAFEVSARKSSARLPVQIADLCVELWQRASTAAAVDLKGGSAARRAIAQDSDTAALQTQVKELREQLQHELISYGELRAQAARHEAASRDALKRLEESEVRGRRHLRDLGQMRDRVVELEATAAQLRERLAATTATRRERKPKLPKRKARSAAGPKAQGKKASRKPTRATQRAAGTRSKTKRRKV